ncbi:MAG: hypothetical protein K6F05_05665 [Succinivibrio sp.]|nr:hypothetical protein [Succinivibrio sp.]
MISLNTVSTSALSALNVSSHDQQGKVSGQLPQNESSAVVKVQSKLSDEVASSELKLDKDSAKAMAADLAAMLSGGQGFGAQANLNSLDAARLLA